MNIIDIIILAIMAFSLLAGMYKGFLSSFMSAVGLFGSWFGARALYERVADFALSNKSLMSVLSQYLEADTFFESAAQAGTSVADVVAGGENAIAEAVSTVGSKLSFLADAFEKNLRGQVFSAQGYSSLSEYLNQTIWVTAFNILAFILTFLVLYWAITLFINLLNHVFHFRAARMVDGLLGGICGLVRGVVFVVLLLNILPMLTSVIVPDLADTLRAESTLWALAEQADFLNIRAMISSLIGG